MKVKLENMQPYKAGMTPDNCFLLKLKEGDRVENMSIIRNDPGQPLQVFFDVFDEEARR